MAMTMNKTLKYGLISIGAILGACIVLIALVSATFNPNDYKPLIVKLVQEKKQRTLKLDGDVKLTFFPRIGADLGKVSLSERKSGKEFAAADGASVSLALLPLLKRRLVVDRIVIDGLRANLVRYPDGTTNIDDLLKKEEKFEQFKFDIGSVTVTNAALALDDRMGGRKLTLSDLRVKTGRIAEGKPGEIALGFRLQGDRPGMDVQVKAASGLLFELDARRLKLDRIDAEVKGEAAGITNLALGLKGGVDFDGTAKVLAIKDLALAAAGMRGADRLDIRLAAPSLLWGGETIRAEKLDLVAQLQQAAGNVDVTLTLPALEGTAKSFHAAKLTLEVNGKQGDSEFKTRLVSPVNGSLESRRLELPAMQASVTLMNPHMPATLKEGGKGWRADISGSARADLEEQNVALDAAARLGACLTYGDRSENSAGQGQILPVLQVNSRSIDQKSGEIWTAQADLQPIHHKSDRLLDASNIKARLRVSRFEAPHYSFDIAIDRLDADRYLPQKAAGKATQPSMPLDFSALKKLDASGSLRIGELKVSNIKSSNVRLDVKAAGGRVLQKGLKGLFG